MNLEEISQMKFKFWVSSILGVCFGLGLSAQDLTVQPPIWVEANDAPDALPVLSTAGNSVKISGGLAELTSPVYRETIYFVGDEKSPQTVSFGTARGSVLFDQIMPHALRPDWKAPAQRAGRAVASEVKVIEVFNPKSAKLGAPDASPRLLHVVPALPPSDDAKPVSLNALEVSLDLDASGAIITATFPENASAPYVQAADRAVRKWTFAPARANDTPVPSRVTIPVLFTRALQFNPDQVKIPPRVKKQSRPEYPYAMRRANIEGQVLVAFVVDVEGRTRDIYPLKSNNPLFEEAALNAVAKWTFDPAQVDGRLVNTRMRVPIIFNIIGGGGNSMFTIQRPRKFPESLPEMFRYDRPPLVTKIPLPTYPFDALRDGLEGKVTVNFIISPTGRIEKAVVKDPQGLDIEEAARTAVELFEFEPAIKDGQPGYALISMELDFKKSGRGDVEVSDDTVRILRMIENNSTRLLGLSELDSIPRPISRRPPVSPLEAQIAGATGEAMIEFVIDRRGFARLPRVISASHPAYGFAAVQAISSWRFEAPRRDGKVVDALARIPIEFNFKAPQ